jgi:hypothetical protein
MNGPSHHAIVITVMMGQCWLGAGTRVLLCRGLYGVTACVSNGCWAALRAQDALTADAPVWLGAASGHPEAEAEPLAAQVLIRTARGSAD